MADQTETVTTRIPTSVMDVLRRRASDDERTVASVIRKILKQAVGKKR